MKVKEKQKQKQNRESKKLKWNSERTETKKLQHVKEQKSNVFKKKTIIWK
jgi:hypothetical protein